MSAWPTVSLMEVCEIEGGTQPPKETFRYEPTDGYVRMLQIQDFKSDESAVFIPESARMKTCEERDVLIARYGASIGRILRGKAGAYNVALVKTVPDEARVERDFLYHLLNGHGFQHFVLNVGSRAAQAGFNKGDLERFQFVLPPLAEQRRIAEVLDRAEALRAKRRAALAQLDSLTQSLFLDLFGDTRKERTRWPTVPLEEIVRETKLGLVRSSQEFGPEFPIPYVRMNAITRNGELELGNVQRTHATEAEVEAYRLEPGDFLFNTRNSEELVGKTALYRGGGLHLFNNNLMRVRFTAKADPVFVAAAFKTAFVQHELNLRKSGTTNVFAIYYKDLRSLPLPLPPISLQREFARRVTAVEALKTAQRASLAELDALFATLQHRAFRGEL